MSKDILQRIREREPYVRPVDRTGDNAMWIWLFLYVASVIAGTFL